MKSKKRWPLSLGGLAAAVALWGCTGRIGEVGSAGAGATSPEDEFFLPSADPAPLRRLTPEEYAQSITDLLGVDISAEATSLPRDGSKAGFDNHSSLLQMSGPHVVAYQRVAEAASAKLVSNAARRGVVVGCDPAGGEPCWREFARRLARLTYRRAPLESELSLLLDVARATALVDTNPWTPIEGVIQVVLQQPQFLFRLEQGVPDGNPERRKLTGYEVATRLSFALWQSGPDDALLTAAESGSLDSAEGVGIEVDRMLADPRSARGVRTFTDQWLRLRRLDTLSFDPAVFPQVDRSVIGMAASEARALVDRAFFADADSFELYTSTSGFVNDALARLYGLPEGQGAELRRVDFRPGSHRGGLFGSAAFAMLTSKPTRTSVVERGDFVRTVALCDSPPPPPPGIANNIDGQTNQSTALGAHLANPACAGCHRSLDPIGYGLERYEATGQLRQRYANGDLLPADGWIEGIEDSRFTDGPQLGALIARHPNSAACLAENYLRWLAGRDLDRTDLELVRFSAREFAEAGRRFRTLSRTFLTSEAFRYRRVPEAP